MRNVQLLATPWWVNLAILVPIFAYATWRKGKLSLTWPQLIFAGLFAIAFGFNEAAVVVYLRAAVGLLPGYGGSLSDVASLASSTYQQAQILSSLPKSLGVVEIAREAATMFMLLGVALAVAKGRRERWALFIWTFGLWDIFYYVGLWLTVRWPPSFTSQDVLFLIPIPWISQVWFPILVSVFGIVAVFLAKKKEK